MNEVTINVYSSDLKVNRDQYFIGSFRFASKETRITDMLISLFNTTAKTLGIELFFEKQTPIHVEARESIPGMGPISKEGGNPYEDAMNPYTKMP